MGGTPTHSGINFSGKGSDHFPGIVKEIEEAAYVMLYETTLLPKLVKKVGQGSKGGMVHIPYFDPTTFSTAAETLTEVTDFTTYTQLTNASVLIYASEFGVASFLTDVTKESSGFDFKGELARQQALSVGVKLEKHILHEFSHFTTNTLLATHATEGLTFTAIAAAKNYLDAQLLTVPGSEKELVINTYGWFYTAKSTYSTSYSAAIPVLGDEVLRKFYVNTVFGDVRVWKSNHITASASASVGAMFVRDAIGLWTPRDYRIEPDRDPSARGDEFTSSMRAGAKMMVNGYGCKITFNGAAPSASMW
jgi:hypothetical protein